MGRWSSTKGKRRGKSSASSTSEMPRNRALGAPPAFSQASRARRPASRWVTPARMRVPLELSRRVCSSARLATSVAEIPARSPAKESRRLPQLRMLAMLLPGSLDYRMREIL